LAALTGRASHEARPVFVFSSSAAPFFLAGFLPNGALRDSSHGAGILTSCNLEFLMVPGQLRVRSEAAPTRSALAVFGLTPVLAD
jgi:hypothetical protein